jgi:hypothetical protein
MMVEATAQGQLDDFAAVGCHLDETGFGLV